MEVEKVDIANLGRLLTGQEVRGQDALDRGLIGKRVFQRLNRGLIAPEGQDDALIIAAAHDAAEKALLLTEHRQGYLPSKSLIGGSASWLEAGLPQAGDHDVSMRSISGTIELLTPFVLTVT